MPRQLPLTPPEFIPSYQTGCGGMPYQQSSYGQPAIRQQDDNSYDFAERYNQLSIAMPPMYPQAGTYMGSAQTSLPPASSFYEPASASILPPMRMQNPNPMASQVLHQQQRAQEYNQRVAQQQAAKEEKPVGGVSAKLDYDMDVMTDFVCEMAVQLIMPNRMAPPSFRKWVHQVLCATRLPSATILFSMVYLAARMNMLGNHPRTEQQLFRLLTISLVLGSKFLDDNTFINRSWADVSGIPVADLNRMETEWLVAIDFTLHRRQEEAQGWDSWEAVWINFQAEHSNRMKRSSKLSPIDTSMHRRSLNQNKPLPPLPMQQNYNAPPPAYEYTPKSAQPSYNNASYPQFDPWRSNNDHSPASAPTTGPTTPEYYGQPATWGPPAEGYSRRTMFGFPPLSQPSQAQAQAQAQHHQHASNYGGPPAYPSQYNHHAWNSHGVNCGCGFCRSHPPYFMAPGFGPQAVAV